MFASTTVGAQEDDEPQVAQATGEVEEVIVVGSRRRDRSAADSPVPVDVVQGDDFLANGGSNLDDLVASLVPSYNVSQEPISDAATFIRPATLRGMAPDATLVLVNGKRRHRAAVIALLGSGISGGSQGPDISAIPAIALDRLEVLRDGASAQYGSDAIAGIMNFVLKEDRDGASLDAKWGSHYEGDGDAVTVAGNVGLPLSDYGFANLSFEWKESDPTSRSRQRADAQGLINAGNSHVRRARSADLGCTGVFRRLQAVRQTSASTLSAAPRRTLSATGRNGRSRAGSTSGTHIPAAAFSAARWSTATTP